MIKGILKSQQNKTKKILLFIQIILYLQVICSNWFPRRAKREERSLHHVLMVAKFLDENNQKFT